MKDVDLHSGEEVTKLLLEAHEDGAKAKDKDEKLEEIVAKMKMQMLTHWISKTPLIFLENPGRAS